MTTIELVDARALLQVDPIAADRPGDDDDLYQLARSTIATGAADPALATLFGRWHGAGDGHEEAAGEGLWQAIKRFLTGVRIEDGTGTRQRWHWPLFVLGCPDVEGAETQLAMSDERARARGWTLSLFGSGFQRQTKVTINDTLTGTAGRGQHRVLFVAHDLDVVEFALVRGGQRVTSGTRLELVPDSGAVGWIDYASAPDWMRPASRIVAMQLSGASETSRQQWSREESYEREYGLVLGGALAPVTLGPPLAYRVSTTVTLRATLPGGRDWDIVKPDQCAGMTVVASR